MNLKTKLLELLVASRGAHISGAALAKELTVSRNAVWKAVQLLRGEGYEITAVTNKGYRLESSGDAISGASVSAYLKNKGAFQIDVRKSVTSTNTVLRELAARGAPEGYVVVAQEQTAGKGRMGRSFHSPAGHGVYFSLLLRPGPKSVYAALITSAAAVAAARAIEQVFGVRAGIKWVNDLLIDGRKVCGILTEATFDMESGLIESAVLGIGINVTRPSNGYPGDIGDVAASLTGRHSGSGGERSRLIAAVLDSFLELYTDLPKRSFLDDYRSRSVLPGQEILVLSQSGNRPALALEIDDKCRLVVRYENGEIAALNSGEVSVRMS